MKLTDVKGSSVIAAHGYDPGTGKLRVKTHTGHIYEHEGVSVEKYAAFTGAASPGTFWNKKIQPLHKAKKISG